MADIKLERYKAHIDRGGYQLAPCDLCGEVHRPLHYHEIINRGLTVNMPEAREAAYSRYLCALLCERCHIGPANAHNPTIARRLLQQNIKRYGRENVESALRRVFELSGGRVDRFNLLEGE